MKLCLSGIEPFYNDQPIDTLIDFSDELGIDELDLWVPRNTSVDRRDDIIAKIEDRKKNVACVTTWSHLLNEDGSGVEISLVMDSLEWAKDLDSPRINTYFGHLESRDDEKAVNLYARNLEKVIKKAEDYGITVCLENEFDSRGHDPSGSDITRSADRFRKLLDLIDHPLFKATFDASNFALAQEEYYPYAFEVLKDRIGYVHIKDARKYIPSMDANRKVWHDHDRSYVFIPLSQGVINWNPFLNEVNKYFPSMPCSLELHTMYSQDSYEADPDSSERKKALVSIMGNAVYQDFYEAVRYLRQTGLFE